MTSRSSNGTHSARTTFNHTPSYMKLQILLNFYDQILIEKSRIYRLKIFWKKFGKSEQKNVMKIYGLKSFSKFFFRKKGANLSIKNARIWLWKRAQIVSFWPFFSLFAFWLGNFSTNQAITYIIFWQFFRNVSIFAKIKARFQQ